MGGVVKSVKRVVNDVKHIGQDLINISKDSGKLIDDALHGDLKGIDDDLHSIGRDIDDFTHDTLKTVGDIIGTLFFFVHGETRVYKDFQVEPIYKNINTSFNKSLIHIKFKFKNTYDTFKELIRQKNISINPYKLKQLGYLQVSSDIHYVTNDSVLNYLYRTNHKNIELIHLYELNKCFTSNINKNIVYLNSLNTDPNLSLGSNEYTYTYNDSITSSIKYSFKYYSYKLNSKEYHIELIDNDVTVRYIDDDEVKLINIKDNSDIIWYEPAVNTSIIYQITFKENDVNKGLLVPRTEVVKKETSYNKFMVIPIKSDGNMIEYNKRHSLVLKQIGIQLPNEFGDEYAKDVYFFSGSKFTPNDPYLASVLRVIYGTVDDPRTVTLNIAGKTLKYTWESTNLKDCSYLKVSPTTYKKVTSIKLREVQYNGFLALSEASITYEGNEIPLHAVNTECHNLSNIEFDKNQGTDLYLIPLEAYRYLGLKKFYDIYYKQLMSATYFEKKVKIKWYQTFLGQFLVTVGVCVLSHNPALCALAAIITTIALEAIINPILKELGVSEDAIQVIDVVAVILVTHEVSNIPATTVQQQASVLASQSSSTISMIENANFNIDLLSDTSMSTQMSIQNMELIDSIDAVGSQVEQLSNTWIQNAEQWVSREINSFENQWNSMSTFNKVATSINYGTKAVNFFVSRNQRKTMNKYQSDINNLNKQTEDIMKQISNTFVLNPFAFSEFATIDPITLTHDMFNRSDVDIMFGSSNYSSYTGFNTV